VRREVAVNIGLHGMRLNRSLTTQRHYSQFKLLKVRLLR